MGPKWQNFDTRDEDSITRQLQRLERIQEDQILNTVPTVSTTKTKDAECDTPSKPIVDDGDPDSEFDSDDEDYCQQFTTSDNCHDLWAICEWDLEYGMCSERDLDYDSDERHIQDIFVVA